MIGLYHESANPTATRVLRVCKLLFRGTYVFPLSKMSQAHALDGPEGAAGRDRRADAGLGTAAHLPGDGPKRVGGLPS